MIAWGDEDGPVDPRVELQTDVNVDSAVVGLVTFVLGFLVGVFVFGMPALLAEACAVFASLLFAVALRPVFRRVRRNALETPHPGPRYARDGDLLDSQTNTDLLDRAAQMHPDDLAACLAHAPRIKAARQATERQARIDAYEAHIADPTWRATPGVAWMRREAELRSALPADYPLPEGVAR